MVVPLLLAAASVLAQPLAHRVEREDRAATWPAVAPAPAVVVWHDDEMCFCEFRPRYVLPADRFERTGGVSVRRDFAGRSVGTVEDVIP